MSVIVKTMKMPKCCRDCIFCEHINFWICIEMSHPCQDDMYETRPDWCPLEEVKDK